MRESSLGLRFKKLKLPIPTLTKTYLWKRKLIFIKHLPATLRTVFPDRHTLQSWQSLLRISRSHFLHPSALMFNFGHIFPIQLNFSFNFGYFSDDECRLQWVCFCLGWGLRRPWIPQPHLSGISPFKYFIFTMFTMENRNAEEATQNKAILITKAPPRWKVT